MVGLISRIKKTHSEFYKEVKDSPTKGKLETYFKAPTKKGWQRGRQVRSNGVELHTLFEKNKAYNVQGRPKRQKKEYRTQESDFDVPKETIRAHPTMIAGIDPGYHNFFSCVRPTGEVDANGERVFEKRFVSKKWYDRRSGRKAIRKKSTVRTRRAQKKGLLTAITNTTFKTTKFNECVLARRDAYATLYAFQTNKRFKKLKFAMRQREDRAIEQLIDYISYGGTVVTAIGDCSKTTGFKSSTPGGPLKVIQRRMVKKGLPVVQVKEAYSTKSSICCHGHENKCMHNGIGPDAYKGGKFKDSPKKVPHKIHGILVCQKCKRTWNRDVVGAINILDIYLADMEGQSRPHRFTHSYWKNQNLSDLQLQGRTNRGYEVGQHRIGPVIL